MLEQIFFFCFKRNMNKMNRMNKNIKISSEQNRK